MRKLKAFALGVGVVNMTTGMTCYDWSIYENKGLHAFLTDSGFLLFGSQDTFDISDEVTCVGNDSGRKLNKSIIVAQAPCIYDELIPMLKSHNYDYTPIKAFRKRASNNRKLKTSFSIKGVTNL